MEYKNPKIWPTFYAVIDFQLPGNESTIGPLKVGESFELDLEPGVKYEVVNLEGNLENGVKLRKTARWSLNKRYNCLSGKEKWLI